MKNRRTIINCNGRNEVEMNLGSRGKQITIKHGPINLSGTLLQTSNFIKAYLFIVQEGYSMQLLLMEDLCFAY